MRRTKKLLLLLGVGVTLLTPLLSLGPIVTNRAQAATSSDAPVTDLLKSYIYIRAIARCIEKAELKDGAAATIPGISADQEVEPHNAEKYKWFSDTDTYLGQFDSDDHNGKKSCSDDDWMQDGFALWGWTDSTTAICYSGFKRENQKEGVNAAECRRGTGNFERDGSDQSARNQFLKNVNKQFYGKEDSTELPTMSAAMLYLYYSGSFLTLCDASKREDPQSYSDSEVYNYETGKGNNHLFKMTNEDGTSFSVYQTGDKDAGDHVTTRANDTNKGYGQIELKCGELAYKANQNAKAYAAYVDASGDTSGTSLGVDTSGDNTDISASCGATSDGFFGSLKFWANPLNWLICPLITGMSTMARILDNQIVGMLCINEGEVFDASASSSCGSAAGTAAQTSEGYKSAWNVFRVVALGLLAIAALVMILSQTSGFEFVDAYTIRKTLPRLLIAAIGITLSWALLQFFVGLANDLGIGVRSLIYSPFSNLAGDGKIVLTGGGGAIGKLVGSAYLLSLGAFGFLLLLASAVLAIIIAFAVLVVRNILVVLLLVTAPIAIAAYVLPNTQNIWKTWWSFLSKALMVFPIITGFIAIGHVFAAISVQQNTLFASLIGFAAYFAPYFLLPATFRFAGGALATIGGFANDRGRGAFDMLKNSRKGIQADRFKRAQNQSLWDNNSRIGKLGNKAATWVTDPVANAAYAGRNTKLLGKAGQRVAGQIEHARFEQSSKLFEEVNKMGYNDKGLRALSGMHYGFSEPVREELEKRGLYMKAPTSLKDIQEIGDVLQKHGSGTELIGGQAMAASAGRLATLYKDPEMGKASISAAGILGLSAHGFASSRDLANTANSLSGGSYTSKLQEKRDDDGEVIINESTGKAVMEDVGNFSGGDAEEAGFALAVAGQAQLLGSRSRPEAKNGYGVMYDGDGKFLDGMISTEDGGGGRMGAVLDTFSAQDLAAAKGGAIKTVRPEIERRLSSPKTEGEFMAMRDNLFSWAGPYSQASADVKVQAVKIIEKHAATDPEFAASWNNYRRMEDPNVRRGGGAGEPPEQSAPPGGV